MSFLETLTEGIVDRDLQKEGAAIQSKWEKTGLLEGLGDDQKKASMAALLENQARELLREHSSMASGDVQGFASVAFPIVRRVFGGLVANELVSVQPMSLPSGLIFFLDFTHSGDTTGRLGGNGTGSVYGGDVIASQITGGVDLSQTGDAEKSYYNLNNGYASPTGSVAGLTSATASLDIGVTVAVGSLGDAAEARVRYDPDLLAAGFVAEASVTLSQAQMDTINLEDLIAIEDVAANDFPSGSIVRRLTNRTGLTLSFILWSATTFDNSGNNSATIDLKIPLRDNLASGDALGSVVGAVEWGLEGPGNGDTKQSIPEIDIKVDSVAITAVTKKLKAKWTPELGQDLNAYHNLDAEVELTSILSEQIALEIDQEMLNELVKGATAATYHWSRLPGLFVDRESGVLTTATADFTGTVSEWYETLLEVVNDVSANIHRKTLRGGATFLVVSPEAANILEFTSGFRADISHDDKSGTAGAHKTGSINKKWDVYVDPYFPRNLVLVGRKGGSFLESGFVYAPYVPLQVTPTIFGVEDFVPRKGVMTRYGKKMVRPDMYGLVIIHNMLGA